MSEPLIGKEDSTAQSTSPTSPRAQELLNHAEKGLRAGIDQVKQAGVHFESGVDHVVESIFSWGRVITWLWVLTMVVIVFVCFPLMIVRLNRENAEPHSYAWFSAALFVCLAVPISLWDIGQHIRHSNNWELQRYIVRIIWMCPIYAIDSFLALRFPEVGIYFRVVRECYEAYVIYNFFMYLYAALRQIDPNYEDSLKGRPNKKHMWGLQFCLKEWQMGSEFLRLTQLGPVVYIVTEIICTIVTFVTQKAGVYHNGSLNGHYAYVYLTAMKMFTQTWALYCLVMFGYAFKKDLAEIRPISKFLVIKAVVFFTFYQSVVIVILVSAGVIKGSETESITYYQDTENVSEALQDFIICIEMFIASLVHHNVFSYREYLNEDDAAHYTPMGSRGAFSRLFDVGDVKEDVLGSFKSVAGAFKKGSETETALIAKQPKSQSGGYGTTGNNGE